MYIPKLLWKNPIALLARTIVAMPPSDSLINAKIGNQARVSNHFNSSLDAMKTLLT